MPSPFPGMDPWLEHPEVFGDLRFVFMTHLQELLQPLLPEPYYAKTRRRTWIELPLAGRLPDDEYREPYVEIWRNRRPDQVLVTVIDVPSIYTKREDGLGRDHYLDNQRRAMQSEVNLIEIDLLRGGKHTTAIPHVLLKRQVRGFDYHVCAHRFDLPDRFEIYLFRMQDRLPVIPVPLQPGDGFVICDLQRAFDRSYDGGPYRRGIIYGEERPEPALTPKQEAWARKILFPDQPPA